MKRQSTRLKKEVGSSLRNRCGDKRCGVGGDVGWAAGNSVSEAMPQALEEGVAVGDGRRGRRAEVGLPIVEHLVEQYTCLPAGRPCKHPTSGCLCTGPSNSPPGSCAGVAIEQCHS